MVHCKAFFGFMGIGPHKRNLLFKNSPNSYGVMSHLNLCQCMTLENNDEIVIGQSRFIMNSQLKFNMNVSSMNVSSFEFCFDLNQTCIRLRIAAMNMDFQLLFLLIFHPWSNCIKIRIFLLKLANYKGIVTLKLRYLMNKMRIC